jgi:hypothetical protein
MSELKIEKVDMAMAALSQLPAEERNIIMDGLREIVKMYSQKNSVATNIGSGNLSLSWWQTASK